jgi:hypothetical protein
MSEMLKQEIEAITAGRINVERRNPGFFWDHADAGRKLTRAEAQVFLPALLRNYY